MFCIQHLPCFGKFSVRHAWLQCVGSNEEHSFVSVHCGSNSFRHAKRCYLNEEK